MGMHAGRPSSRHNPAVDRPLRELSSCVDSCVRRTCVHPSLAIYRFARDEPTTWRTRGIIRRRSACPPGRVPRRPRGVLRRTPSGRHGRRCSAHWLKPSARIAFRAIPARAPGCVRPGLRQPRASDAHFTAGLLRPVGQSDRPPAASPFMVSTIPRHTRSRDQICTALQTHQLLAGPGTDRRPSAVTTSPTKTCLDMTCSERTCIAVVKPPPQLRSLTASLIDWSETMMRSVCAAGASSSAIGLGTATGRARGPRIVAKMRAGFDCLRYRPTIGSDRAPRRSSGELPPCVTVSGDL